MLKLSRLLFGVAILAAISAFALILFGGFDTQLWGIRIAARDPFRAFAAATLALALAAAFRGIAESAATLERITASFNPRNVALLLAAGAMTIGIAFASTVAGGPDPFGYVSQSDRWLAGELRTDLPVHDAPWPNAPATWAPLGYVPAQHDGKWTIVPLYSPGLPLMMAAAKAMGGQEPIFWIVPISAGLLVFSSYRIGLRLGSERAGCLAAWFVATSPVVMIMLVQPMSDLPAAAAWAVAFDALLGLGIASAFGAGVASALAVLIRPNLALLVFLPGVWLVSQALFHGRPTARVPIGRALAFAAGAAPGFVAVAAINTYLKGAPLVSGYGDLSNLFHVSNIPRNAAKYLAWLAQSHTPLALAGLAAVFVPWKRLWPGIERRSIFLLIGSFVLLLWAQYSAYLQFDDWPFLRFLLPSWPFVMLGLASAMLLVVRWSRPAATLVAAWTIFAMGAYGLRVAQRAGAFAEWESARRYVDVARHVAAHSEDRSVTLALLHTGSVRYYGGRLTLRYDQLNREWLDRTVSWLSSQGRHVYALLEPWEVTEFEQHFAGQQTAARLRRSAVFAYRGPNVITFYDLTESSGGATDIAPHQNLREFRSRKPVWPLSTPTAPGLSAREGHYP